MSTTTPATINLVTNGQPSDIETEIRKKLPHFGYQFVTSNDDPTITLIISFKDAPETIAWIRDSIEHLEFGGYAILVHRDVRNQHPELFETDSLPPHHEAKKLLKSFNLVRDIHPSLNSMLQYLHNIGI
ncbi:hypothetical protein HN670_03605 [bacterium]|jgi:hypothetical protein|nr:hypothetical protein [bacterium]